MANYPKLDYKSLARGLEFKCEMVQIVISMYKSEWLQSPVKPGGGSIMV